MSNYSTSQTIRKWFVREKLKIRKGNCYKYIYTCRNNKDVLEGKLKNKTSTSCGYDLKEIASKRFSKDYTHLKFNHLLAIKRLPNYKNKKTYYKCLCDCGNTRIVYGYYLTSGEVKMCKECVKKEEEKKLKEKYIGKRYNHLTIMDIIRNDKGEPLALCKCACGNVKEIKLSNVRNGHTSLCGCFEKSSRYNRKHHVDIANKRFGMLTAIRTTNKRKNNGGMIWECKCDCGNIAFVSYYNLSKGKTTSCGCRKTSKWEDFIDNYLSSLNIDFVREKRFDDCKNAEGTSTLPFDFYLPKYKIIIEYDGEQHFAPVKYWGGEEKFKRTQQNDSIKNEYCKTRNFSLLRLSYKLSENEIKEKIQNILNP